MYSPMKIDLFFRRTFLECMRNILKFGRNVEFKREQFKNLKILGDPFMNYSPCWIQHPLQVKYASYNNLSRRLYCTVVELEEKPKQNALRPPKEVAEEEIAQQNARLTRVMEYIRLMIKSDKPIIIEDLRVVKLLQLINEAQIDKQDRSHTGPGKYPGRNYDFKDKEYRDKTLSTPARVDDPSVQSRSFSAWGRPINRHYSTVANIMHSRTYGSSSDKACTDTKELLCKKCTLTESVIEAINDQINWELFASYTYLNIASYFNRTDVALNGFYTYFMFMSEDETKHALSFINFLNNRGGRVKFKPIKTPEKMEIKDACTALAFALALERNITGKIIHLQEHSEKMKDCHTNDFVIVNYVYEQFETIREMELLLSQMKLVSTGLGIYLIDKDLLEKYEPKRKKN